MTSEKDQKIINQATEYYKLAIAAERDNRHEMIDDLKFAALDQWPDEVKSERQNRPMLTHDQTNQIVNRILGDIRESLPGIKIGAGDDQGDTETAEIIESLIRQIQAQSGANKVYMRAAAKQVKCGYGVWRVHVDFATHDAFDQDITLKYVKNPFQAYFDPADETQTKHEGRFQILSGVIPINDFKKKYPKADSVSFDNVETGEIDELWYDEDNVRIIEYWVRRPVTLRLAMLSNGNTIDLDQITDEEVSAYAAQGIFPVREREAESYKIDYYKMTGAEILERREWMSRYMPLVPVYGIEEDIEGKTNYRGIIRAAKDPQRLYNYAKSAEAEAIALQPKTPYVVTAKQIQKYKRFWQSANRVNHPYLPYDPDGTAPPPQRQPPVQISAGIANQIAGAANDIQAATGVYNSSLGASSNEIAGVAINARQSETGLGTSEFLFNLAASIEHTGRIIVDLIPKIYDTHRIVKIRGEDDLETQSVINNPIFTPDGVKIQNDLTRGKYDVRVSIGPSYKTRRAESAASMLDAIRVFPQLQQIAGDLIAKNLDWPGADEIAKRLQKLLPPGIIDDPELEGQQAQVAETIQQQQEIENAKILADIENTQADTAKKYTEAEENEIENLVKAAEIAQQSDNQALTNAVLVELINALRAA